MAGSLRKADIPGNDGAEDLAGEVPADFFSHLIREIGSTVEHGQRHAEDLQSGVHAALHSPQGAHQIAQTLQRVILTLDGDQNAFCGGQAVQGQHFQGRGAIDEDQIVISPDLFQRFCQTIVGIFHTQQLHTRTGQVGMGGEHVAIARGDDGFDGIQTVDDNVVDGVLDVALVHAQSGRSVGLGIEIHQQDLQSQIMECSRQIDCGGGFAHAALLIDHCDYFAHRLPPIHLNLRTLL